MQLIKVKFLKNDLPSGREYTYYSNELVKPGDVVQINSKAKGVVVSVDVDESEIEAFKDKVKQIIGKAVESESLGIIQSIKVVRDLELGNTSMTMGSEKRAGINSMIHSLIGSTKYDGYEVVTDAHRFHVLIENGQNCYESWGCICSEDDVDMFIGKQLVSVELTDVSLNKEKLKEEIGEVVEYGFDGGGIQFVDFKCSDGNVFQLAVYNDQNGYYGHGIIVSRDSDIIEQNVLKEDKNGRKEKRSSRTEREDAIQF